MEMLQEAPLRLVELVPAAPARVTSDSERLARRALRRQIANLERELSAAFVTAFEMGAAPPAGARASEPRMLDLAGLEHARDDLVERLARMRALISEVADEQHAKRLLLERMLLEPGRHRFYRITCRELGERSCGAWEVRPRLGLIGMLMGWWQVKLSSGCPLAGGRGSEPRPASPTDRRPRRTSSSGVSHVSAWAQRPILGT